MISAFYTYILHVVECLALMASGSNPTELSVCQILLNMKLCLNLAFVSSLSLSDSKSNCFLPNAIDM